MLVERIENKWLAAFTRTFTLCKVQPGEVVAILAPLIKTFLAETP